MLAFSVDTHLLRELGLLLVGRDSTALVELLKNSYDADATHVVVHGERLGTNGEIAVRDDGHGMTYLDFVEKFLRIAGRSKEGVQGRSPLFGRRFTGAKGIGRLSAHKLAQQLNLESQPDIEGLKLPPSTRGVVASINWSAIERSRKSIDAAKEIGAREVPARTGTHGTSLLLKGLHDGWTPRKLGDFLAEVRSTRADAALVDAPPVRVFRGDSLLGGIKEADTGPDDPGLTIELSGDFAGSDSQWPTLLSHVNWVIEINALIKGSVTYRISPSIRTEKTYTDASVREFTIDRPASATRYAARIYVRDGSDSSDARLPDALTKFARQASGVRLFYEGFRVLPYGAPRNDWLGLDQATVRREALTAEAGVLSPQDRSALDERTYQLSNSSYFGGVFLHDSASGGLQMVVNREGFLPGSQFDELVATVRRGIDLSVRIRAAHGANNRAEAKRIADAQRRREVDELLRGNRREPLPTTKVTVEQTKAWLEAGKAAAVELRSNPLASDLDSKRNLAIVTAALDQLDSASDETLDERAQLRILASLGTQVGAFVHEVNGVLGQARVVRDMLADILLAPQSGKGDLEAVLRAQDQMILSLERQAVYLTDSLGAEARRRRARQPVRERFETAVRLLGVAAAARNVEIRNEIPESIKTRPMFAAEMNVIFTNLLSNAIKAAAKRAGSDDRPALVVVRAEKSDYELVITVENTGVPVAPSEGERWFRAFETTTQEIDSALGQGLGMGLTLTRRIVEEYDGDIRFVAPSRGMSAAVQVSIPID